MAKNVSTTTRIVETFCPSCFTRLDAATSMYSPGAPSPGDFTICLECASVLTFNDNMQLVASTLAECPIQIRSQLAQIKMFVEEFNRDSQKGGKGVWER